VTFRIHGESGVAEGNYDLWEMIFSGTAEAGRPVQIDMHAKGIDDKMIETALSIGNPVTVSPKFWAEHLGLPYHQAAIRELEMPRATNAAGQFALSNGTRSFLRYGYGDLLTRDRKYGVISRIWPGTQRFLLWADPAFAADYGRAFSFGGIDGFELFDPLSFKGRQGSGQPGHRTAYNDASGLQPAYDDQKFALTYRLWGRLTYNPEAAREVWEREYRAEFGEAAGTMEAGLSAASRILPLITTSHLPSGANLTYWPEIYTNLSLVDPSKSGPFTDTPAPRIFPNVSPIDPQLFATVTEYVEKRLAVEVLLKVTPAEVAEQLDAWAAAAEVALAKAPAGGTAAVRRAVIDARIVTLMGRFFARKLRASIALAVYQRTGETLAREQALTEYRAAREAWAGILPLAKEAYVSNIAFGPTAWLQGSWADRLPAIDADIAAVERANASANVVAVPETPVDHFLHYTINPIPKLSNMFGLTHEAVRRFVPGQAVKIAVTSTVPPPTGMLFYRHVNQGERWKSAALELVGDDQLTATIPGEYTNSPYALQYYIACSMTSPRMPVWSRTQFLPGFSADFRGQPYYVIEQA
jgi:hypothetical protein